MAGPRKARIPSTLLIPVIADAAIAGPIADGRMLPVLILDTSGRPDVDELIRVHRHLGDGNVWSQWATSRDDNDQVALHLRFDRPMDVEMALTMSIRAQGVLVEMILSTRAAYLLAGRPGDRLITKLEAPRVLVEIAETGFRPHWNRLFFDVMNAEMARRLGVSRRKARGATETLIARAKEIANLQLQPPDGLPIDVGEANQPPSAPPPS
jgi:hypothetical protein